MKKVKVGKSKIHGNGLFADEPIKRGDVIELVHTMRELEPGVMKTTPTLLGRNYNHSEEANALNVVDGNNRYLVALKEIEAGGEITTDYRTNPELEQPGSFTSNDNYVSFDYDDTLTTPEGFKLAQQMNKEGKNLYVITARDKVTPQMIERAEAAGIPKENIITAGSDEAKVKIVKENNISKHIDNKESVIKALGDTGELFTPDAYPDLKADFVEMELSDDDLNKLREGGFIIDKYPNGGLVEVRGYEGNKFRKNANGKWEYESGRPVEDQLLIQKLTYESKPVGSPVVQGAPKVSLKPIPTRSENLKMISDLSMSPRIADQEKATQLSELQREQDIFNPQEPDMIMKPKNMNDLKGYEFQVNRALGFPMDKAHFAAEAAAGDVNEEVDNFRHPLAGRYTTEAIRDYVADVPYERIPLVGGYVNDFMDQYIAPSLGFAGSNLLGASHEFMTLVNPGEDDRSLLTRLSEAGEDLYNNYVGSKVGASDMTPEEKTNYLLYLSYNNKLPDGVVIEKDPKAKGPNNLYFKKRPNDPGRYKSSYANGGESKGRKKDSKGRYRSEDGNVRTPITPEMQAVMPAEEWGQYVQEIPEVYTTRTREQQDIRNALDYQQRMAELYPGRPTQSDAIQPADWFWQLGLGAKPALEGLNALAAAKIPYTGISLGTAANVVGGIHGATQVPQRIEDWQEVVAGNKNWKEAAAETAMTALELGAGAYEGVNALRFKPDPSMYYRGIGPEGYEDAINTGLFRQAGFDNKNYNNYKDVWYATGDRGFAKARDFSKNYIAEVPRSAFPETGDEFFGSALMPTRGTKRHIPIEEGRILKKDWLRGYKEVPKKLPGSPNTFKSSLGSMDMSKYEIKNPDYFTQLLNTYDSRRLSNSNKQFYKDLIANVKKQNGIATERQYNELQRLRTGNFNFGKKGYSNGGPINLFENQRPNSKLNKFIR